MKYLRSGKVNLAFGASVGSEGKGLLIHFLALKEKPDWAACVFSPNAGHCSVDETGKLTLVKQIPTSVLNPTTKLIIGPDAAINLDVLEHEIDEHKLDSSRLFISDRAIVIEKEDIDWEKVNLWRLSSTFQGVGAAKARRVRRENNLRFVNDIEKFKPFVVDTTQIVHQALYRGETILMEGHQGFGLDLLHGIAHPFNTSSMTNTSYFMAALGVPPCKVGEVIAAIRPYPIRVGNAASPDGSKMGDSGPLPPDSAELQWDEVMRRCGGPVGHREMTTVTKRIRRVFDWSDILYRKMINVCGPTQVFVNFIQYVDWAMANKRGGWDCLTERALEFIRHIDSFGVKVTLVGTGPCNLDIIERMDKVSYPALVSIGDDDDGEPW